MTREEIVAANDLLRTAFKGGRVEVCHGPYELDDRTLGRMLSVLARYSTFEEGSLHDRGTFIFAGFSFEWEIVDVDGERVLRVCVERDALHEGPRLRAETSQPG
jgi:hypothetical protein